MNQERKKKYLLKLSILGVRIYVCNLNLKPYLRPLDNRNSSGKRKFRMPLYNRGGGKCEYCGKPIDYNDMQLHHIVPLSMNGNNNPHNIMCICDECHRLIHCNPVVNQQLIDKLLQEHPEVRENGRKDLMDEVKEARMRKTLYDWHMPGISFKVIQ